MENQRNVSFRHQHYDLEKTLRQWQGDEAQIDPLVKKHGGKNSEHVKVVHAEDVITMKEEPLVGIRRKPKASINVAMNLVKQKEDDAVVSAGHSGAAMAAAVVVLSLFPLSSASSVCPSASP